MQMTVNGHGLEITPAISEYVRQKFERIFRHANPQSASVLLKLDGLVHVAEGKVHSKEHAQLFASSGKPDMYAAIDDLADKLDRQLRKSKTKRLRQQHNGESLRSFAGAAP